MTQPTAHPGTQTCQYCKVGAASTEHPGPGGFSVSHTGLFLPRILMNWTFLRETSWQSSWKGRMAGGLWNEMDDVALSLGHTWRSSEERPAVPTYLCPDCEVKDCSHHRPSLSGSEPWLAAMGMGWLLATLNKLLPGVKGQAHPSFAGVLFSYPVPRVLIQKARVQESGRPELCHLQTSGSQAQSQLGTEERPSLRGPQLRGCQSYIHTWDSQEDASEWSWRGAQEGHRMREGILWQGSGAQEDVERQQQP